MDKPTFTQPVAVPVPLRGGEITVQTAVMGPLLAAKSILIPVLRRLAEAAPGAFDGERLQVIAETKMVTATDIQDFCVLADEADVAVDLLAILAPMPREKVLQLLPDEFFYLLAVAVQVNVDFFSQALHVFKAAEQRVGPAWREAQGAQPGSGTSSLPTPSTP